MASSLLFSFVVICAMAWTVRSASMVMTTAPSGCTWNGKWYPAGQQFKPDPCTYCRCEGGRAMCAVADCAPPQCVDYVRDPDQCCPTCPNGSNCKAPDGTIISAGQTVHIHNMVCSCSGSGGFMMSTDALCLVQATAHAVIN